MPSFFANLALLAAFFWVSPAARATTFVHVPFPQTVDEASQIARGVTGRPESDWGTGADGARRLFTYTDLEVREVIKGDIPAKAKIKIRTLGGEKNGVGMVVSGSAQFTPGEDVVLMLGDRNQDGSYDVKGMAMGKYTVATDSDGREVLVGMGLDDHLPEGTPDVPGAVEKKVTLAELRDIARTPSAPPVNASPSPEAKSPIPSASESVSLTNAPEAAPVAASPAPADPVESKEGWPIALGLGGALLFVAAAWLFFRKR